MVRVEPEYLESLTPYLRLHGHDAYPSGPTQIYVAPPAGDEAIFRAELERDVASWRAEHPGVVAALLA